MRLTVLCWRRHLPRRERLGDRLLPCPEPADDRGPRRLPPPTKPHTPSADWLPEPSTICLPDRTKACRTRPCLPCSAAPSLLIRWSGGRWLEIGATYLYARWCASRAKRS